MGQTTCPDCGANVQVAKVAKTGQKVALELHTDASSDADRYRILELGPPLVVVKVPTALAGDYYPAHVADCPAHGAGL